MTIRDYEALLMEARLVLEHYMFDGVDLRDDVAEICLGNAEFAGHGATLLRIRAD